jgi:acetyl esterase/lipase
VIQTQKLILIAAVAAAAMLAGCRFDDEAPAVAPLACAVAPVRTIPLRPDEVPCSDRSDPRVAAISNEGIELTSMLGLAAGRYALPDTDQPTDLVIFFHGHQNDSCSWRNHLREAAAHGAVAVAMNYTGQEDRVVEPYGLVENWGWAVRAGADDSVAAARYFLHRYPSIQQVFNFGTSMGGNVSGYANYVDGAVREDCSPLWDYWIATEGVHNLTEEYTAARTVAESGSVAGAQATQEIEEENGGTLEEVPEAYAEITNTQHAAEMAFLKGAVMVHGTNDQTVPVEQSRSMTDNLRSAGVPVALYPVANSDHVWEGSSTLKVMRVGLDELFRLMAGGVVVDGETPVEGP